MGVLGGLVNAQVAVAVRIAALRRSSPDVTPHAPMLIATEFPILAVEAALAALTSFTLVGRSARRGGFRSSALRWSALRCAARAARRAPGESHPRPA
jgi:hypothetical protein